MSQKFSEIASGGPYVPATDQVMVVRNGATDVLVGRVAAGPGTSVADHLAAFTGTDGATLKDSGKAVSSLVPYAGATGDISANTHKVTSLGTPTADTDASTKKYVDDTVAALTAGAVTDGTYTVGAQITPVTGTTGTITVVNGIITAIQEAT